MEWHGYLGIALLAYVPMAYLLLRAGHRRRVWAGAAATGFLAVGFDGDLYAPALADVGVTRTLWTGALAVVLLAAVAAGFRPLLRGERYTVAVTGFQVAIVGLVSQLIAGTVASIAARPVYPAYDGAATMTFEVASDADVSAGLLVAGLVTFLLALGYARIHGPIGSAVEARTPRNAMRRPSEPFERSQRSVPTEPGCGGSAGQDTRSRRRASLSGSQGRGREADAGTARPTVPVAARPTDGAASEGPVAADPIRSSARRPGDAD